MLIEYMSLKLIWWGIMSLLLIAFAITGGIDIGVSFLLPIIGRNDRDRRLIINSIGPTWEGNQVWLITFGAGMFAIWPDAYATAFSSLYYALMLVLLMLILRPPGIDYRSKINSALWRGVWDACLYSGGFILALVFGVAVGNLFTGMDFTFTTDLRVIYTGNFFDLFSVSTLLFGLVSVCMLATQASLFLQYKLDTHLSVMAKNLARGFSLAYMILFVITGIYVIMWVDGYEILQMPNVNATFAITDKIVVRQYNAWLNNYLNAPIIWLVPLFAIICMRGASILSKKSKPVAALLVNSLAIAATILTAAVSLFPFVLPSRTQPGHSLTIWDACSSHLTLEWALYTVAVMLPIILIYTYWAYSVMRGPVKLTNSSY